MFNFGDMFIIGMQVEVYGETWVLVSSVRDDFFTAVKANSTMPAQTYLIRYDMKAHYEKEREEKKFKNLVGDLTPTEE